MPSSFRVYEDDLYGATVAATCDVCGAEGPRHLVGDAYVSINADRVAMNALYRDAGWKISDNGLEAFCPMHARLH